MTIASLKKTMRKVSTQNKISSNEILLPWFNCEQTRVHKIIVSLSMLNQFVFFKEILKEGKTGYNAGWSMESSC